MIDPQALISELVAMVLNDPHRGTEDEEAFLGMRTRPRTEEIGRQLHSVGGHAAMVEAYDAVRGRHGAGSARSLEMAWDGIGDWLG